MDEKNKNKIGETSFYISFAKTSLDGRCRVNKQNYVLCQNYTAFLLLPNVFNIGNYNSLSLVYLASLVPKVITQELKVKKIALRCFKFEKKFAKKTERKLVKIGDPVKYFN